MRAWAIDRYGKNSVLKLRTFPEPRIEDDEVLIGIKAASINPVDFKIRNGDLRLVLRYPFPLILGNDCAGIVVKAGPKVSRFKLGDEVYARPHKDRIGTLAEFVAAREDAVAKRPANISFEEAASLPLIALTAWQSLLTRCGLKAGQRIFIPAGSGGVGTFAIQLAKHIGAYVIANTGAKNVEFVKSLGADEVIDYKSEDFLLRLRDIDIVFDTMGGETQKKAFSILKPGGVLISIVGPPTARFAREIGLGPVVQAFAFLAGLPAYLRARRRGCDYQFMLMLPDGQALQEIAKLVETKAIRPVIDRVFPFEKADEALSYVEAGHARGKVVVSMRGLS